MRWISLLGFVVAALLAQASEPAAVPVQRLEWPLAGAWRIAVERDGSGQLAYGQSAVDVWPFPAGTVDFPALLAALRQATEPTAGAPVRRIEGLGTARQPAAGWQVDPSLPALRSAWAAIRENLAFADRRRLERFRRLSTAHPPGEG